MTTFVDSNVPMYLVGGPHPHKLDAQRLLQRCVADGDRMVTDAEVFQEILHRFGALGRHDALQPTFDLLVNVVDEVFPVELPDVDLAKNVLLGAVRLSARDALHVAVMRRRSVGRILSFDTDYDAVPGIVRLWR